MRDVVWSAPAPLWVWVLDLHTISAEIASEAPKPREMDREALLEGSDYTPHDMIWHSSKISRGIPGLWPPIWEVIPQARVGPSDLRPGTYTPTSCLTCWRAPCLEDLMLGTDYVAEGGPR